LEEFLAGRMPEQRMGLHEVMEDVEERWRIVTRVFPIHDHPTRFGSKEVPGSEVAVGRTPGAFMGGGTPEELATRLGDFGREHPWSPAWPPGGGLQEEEAVLSRDDRGCAHR
jgi:hypothetical protein